MTDHPYSTRSSKYKQKTGKVSSRLAKTEQKKLFQQTALIIIASIAVLLIFLFVILPSFIRLAVNLSEGSISFEESDTVPPQTPIVSAPPAATTESLLTISGFGEPGSTVTLIVNEGKTAETTVDEDGAFSVEVELDQGENRLKAYSTDAAKNESGLTPVYTVISDNQPPTIELATPEDGKEYVSKQYESISVEGTTEPKAYVFVNGRRYRADDEGNFKASVRLEEGENTIALKAEDLAGNTTEDTITVRYRE